MSRSSIVCLAVDSLKFLYDIAGKLHVATSRSLVLKERVAWSTLVTKSEYETIETQFTQFKYCSDEHCYPDSVERLAVLHKGTDMSTLKTDYSVPAVIMSQPRDLLIPGSGAL